MGDKKKKKGRNRSKSFFLTSEHNKMNGMDAMENMKKRPSVNMLINDEEYSDDLSFDEDSYSNDSDNATNYSKVMIPNKLTVIHSASDHQLFDENEGTDTTKTQQSKQK